MLRKMSSLKYAWVVGEYEDMKTTKMKKNETRFFVTYVNDSDDALKIICIFDSKDSQNDAKKSSNVRRMN